jgi:nucleoside phosphorylase
VIAMPLIDHLVLVPLGEEWRVVGPLLYGDIEPYEEPEKAVSYYSWPHSVTVQRGRFDPPVAGDYLTVAASMGTLGQTNASAVATEAVSKWDPARVILLGIAGSIDPKWLHLGDVVAPDLIFGYELETVDGNPPQHRFRPIGYQAGAVLVDQVRALWNDSKSYEAWQKSCADAAPSIIRAEAQARPPKLRVVPMASGNQVVRSVEQGRLLRAAISPLISAVEMEAAGVFHAAWRGAGRPDVLMIRGISDLADENKTELEASTHDAWREYAAANAARLARALWGRRTLPMAAPPVSPPIKINVSPAPRPKEYFLKKNPITKANEITIDYRHPGSQVLAFLDFIRRRGATPLSNITVNAFIKGGKPVSEFRLQLVIEDEDQRSITGPIAGANGLASFEIGPTSSEIRMDLMVSAPSELQSIHFRVEDYFGRTATAVWE